MADIPSHATTVDEEMHKSPLASTEAIPVLLTDANVKKHRNIRGDSYRFAACLFCMLLSGWNDGSTGALIPTLEKHFSINYVTVSTLFIGSCSGYILAAFLATKVTDKYGRGKVISAGAVLQVISYAAATASPPFPVYPCIFAINGFGAALQQCQMNAFVANLPNAAHKLCYVHGAYGVGGLTGPLAATAFVTSGLQFYYFFGLSLGIAVINATLMTLSFRLKRETSMRTSSSLELSHFDAESRREVRESRHVEAAGPGLLKSKTVWATAVFLCLYCGAEVSTGGWIVSELIQDRNAPISAGYVAAGFWTGVTAGRLFLPHFNILVGERLVIFCYTFVALILQLVMWKTGGYLAAAVAVALVGVALGPIFPVAISVMTKILPKRQHTGAIGIVSCTGSTGCALFPFIVGVMAQKYDVWVLYPTVVALAAFMLLAWSFVPRIPHNID